MIETEHPERLLSEQDQTKERADLKDRPCRTLTPNCNRTNRPIARKSTWQVTQEIAPLKREELRNRQLIEQV